MFCKILVMKSPVIYVSQTLTHFHINDLRICEDLIDFKNVEETGLSYNYNYITIITLLTLPRTGEIHQLVIPAFSSRNQRKAAR